MTRLERTDSWFQKETKKDISILNFFFSIFPLWFSILNNLLIMNSLIGIMKDFVSSFSTMFQFYIPWNYPSNLWFSDVFREHKRGTVGRNKSSFLTHFSPVFLFCTHCECQKTLGLLLFPEVIKLEHWVEMGEILSYLSYYLHNLRTAFFKEQLSLIASGFLNRL